MGLVRHGVPEELVLALKAEAKIDCFLETGTFLGDTTSWAAQHFSHVITIEADGPRHVKAVERFKDNPCVLCLEGESSAVLAHHLTLSKPTILWLDAHWMGTDSGTAGESFECPVLNEIKAVNRYLETHIIIVDDARYFCAPPPHPHQAGAWPSLAQIVGALDNERRYVVIYEDAIIAVPCEMKSFLVAWLQERITDQWLRLNGLK